MQRFKPLQRCCALALFVVVAGLGLSYGQSSDEPETVLITYHPKAGQEGQLLETIKKDWAALRRLRLVDESPHIVMRGKDASGAAIYVEVFTWVTADTPDHVPAEVQAIWQEMGKQVENATGRPGIDIRPVTLVPDGQVHGEAGHK